MYFVINSGLKLIITYKLIITLKEPQVYRYSAIIPGNFTIFVLTTFYNHSILSLRLDPVHTGTGSFYKEIYPCCFITHFTRK